MGLQEELRVGLQVEREAPPPPVATALLSGTTTALPLEHRSTSTAVRSWMMRPAATTSGDPIRNGARRGTENDSLGAGHLFKTSH